MQIIFDYSNIYRIIGYGGLLSGIAIWLTENSLYCFISKNMNLKILNVEYHKPLCLVPIDFNILLQVILLEDGTPFFGQAIN